LVSIVPSPYVVAHVKRITTSAIDPDSGDAVVVDAPAVIRRAQSLAQLGNRGSSHQIFDTEHLKRIDTELRLAVADPSIYQPQDQVILFPSVDNNGDYEPGSGVAFFVDGLVLDSRQSPFPLLTKMFGGVLALKRVS
jgi:hypothetical protein